MHNKVRVLETAQKPDLLHAPAQCGAALALDDVDVAGGAAVDGQEARHVRRHALHEAVQLVRRHRRQRQVVTVTVPTLATAENSTSSSFSKISTNTFYLCVNSHSLVIIVFQTIKNELCMHSDDNLKKKLYLFVFAQESDTEIAV